MSNDTNEIESQPNPAGPSQENRTASPASTGGAGTFFEQNVGAYWLAQLLVGGIPPILIDCSVAEVHFQTEHLGWHTDDFLVVGQSGPGKLRKLAGQVKRTFTVSAIDEDCKNTVQDFWRDFKSPDRFSPLSDRLAVVTQRGTNTLLEHFSGLLDCSRADIKKMVDESAPRFELMKAKLGLLMWGLKVFKHEDIERFGPDDWRRRLEEARAVKVTNSDKAMGAQGGPGIVAAVCVRDHWKEMTVDEQAWCVKHVCSEIARDANNWNYIARGQRFDMSADRACAWVVSTLIDKPMSEKVLRRVQDAFVIALTHPTDEVRWYPNRKTPQCGRHETDVGERKHCFHVGGPSSAARLLKAVRNEARAGTPRLGPFLARPVGRKWLFCFFSDAGRFRNSCLRRLIDKLTVTDD